MLFAGSSNPPLGVVRAIRASLVQCTDHFLDAGRVLDAGRSVSSIAANAAAETTVASAPKTSATNARTGTVATAIKAAAANAIKTAAPTTAKTASAITAET